MTAKQLKLLKLGAAGAALIYLYYLAKSRGMTLKGAGLNVKADNIMRLAGEFAPEELRPLVHREGVRVLNRFMER